MNRSRPHFPLSGFCASIKSYFPSEDHPRCEQRQCVYCVSKSHTTVSLLHWASRKWNIGEGIVPSWHVVLPLALGASSHAWILSYKNTWLLHVDQLGAIRQPMAITTNQTHDFGFAFTPPSLLPLASFVPRVQSCLSSNALPESAVKQQWL